MCYVTGAVEIKCSSLDDTTCGCRYTDMESEDYDFYRGLVFLLENTVNDLGYDLTFSTEVSVPHT